MSAAPALGRLVVLREHRVPIEVRPHPRGAQGIREAMAWMVERIAQDARDERVIAWARQAIAMGHLPDPRGYPHTPRIVSAILARFERETIFCRDPVDTEAIGGTVQVLCLDADGLCLAGGDCDDLVRAIASCLLAVGIPVRLRLRFYAGKNLAHIVVEYDASPSLSGQWTCLDPSVSGGVCSTAAYTSEILMEVTMGDMDQPGTFVGMGAPLEGLEEGVMGDPPTDLSTQEVQAWVKIVQWVKAELDESLTQLQASTTAYTNFRTALGLPQYDTATTTPPAGGDTTTATGPIQQYFNDHQWTAAAQAAETQLLSTGQFCSQCLGDALTGARAMYWNAGDVLVASKPGDPYRLSMVTNATTNTKQVTYLDASGTATGTMGAVGLVDILIGGAIVAALTVAVCWAVKHYSDAMRSAHHDDALAKISDNETKLVASGAETPEQKNAALQAATAFAAAGPPSSDGLPSLATSAVVAVVAALAGGAAVYYLGPWLFGSMLRREAA